MKIILVLFFALMTLPQGSFGASPEWTAFVQRQDEESRAYYGQKAKERDVWKEQNRAFVAELDKYGRDMASYQVEQRQAAAEKRAPRIVNAPAPPADYNTYQVFVAQEANENQAFLAQMSQDKNQFLADNPGIDTSS